MWKRAVLFATAGLLVGASLLWQNAGAQALFELPRVSPAASVTQRIGLTDITIDYHRPGVKGRTIWGGLVPYGEVWRVGANENTTVTFSTSVSIDGSVLDTGTYGLHMIPTTDEWTVILSRQSHAWGSFSYEKSEDVLRVQVVPQAIPFQERLSYTFDEIADHSVVVSLNWEKFRIPIRMNIDVNAVMVQNLRTGLRGLPRFSWRGWSQAATWCLANDVNTEEALQWAERAVSMSENFTTLQLQADLLEKTGDAKTAAGLREKAMKMATEVEMNTYGYQLAGQGKLDEAIDVFEKNVADHPRSWNVYDSLAEAYARKGNKRKAVDMYKKAFDLVQIDGQKSRIKKAIADLQ